MNSPAVSASVVHSANTVTTPRPMRRARRRPARGGEQAVRAAIARCVLVLVVLLLAWFLWPAPSRVGRSMIESPAEATPIIEVRILHEQVDMWMML